MPNMAINSLGYFPLIKNIFFLFFAIFLLILSLITFFTVLTFMKWAYILFRVKKFYLVSYKTNF